MAVARKSLILCARCGMILPRDEALCPGCDAGEPDAHFEKPVFAGKYRLEHQLGVGGMGTVYRATDLSLDRQIAIKVLHAGFANDTDLVARFEREARMMARLEHPNLVPIYAVDKFESIPYIVMKLLDGSTLAQLRRARGRKFFPSEVTPLLAQLAAGLGFMHDKGIVHRDLKPGNLYVGPAGHVTILDFGIARDSRSQLTRPGASLGTPHYMSPEQTMSTDLGAPSDLYSVGVILFELVTGRPPFSADSEFEMMRAHRVAPVPDAEALGLTSRPVAEVLARLLAKKPEHRPASIRVALDAWIAATAQEPEEIETAPANEPARPVKLMATPAPAARALEAAHDPGERTEVAALKPSETLEEPPTVGLPEPPARRPRWPLFATGALVLIIALAAAILGMPLIRATPPPAAPPTPVPIAQPVLQPVAEPEPPEPEPERIAEPTPEPSTPEAPPVVAPPAHTRAARPKTGELRVVVSAGEKPTWGLVKVDGVEHGYAPTTLQLSAGAHDVTVVRGSTVLAKATKVVAGSTTVLKFEVQQ